MNANKRQRRSEARDFLRAGPRAAEILSPSAARTASGVPGRLRMRNRLLQIIQRSLPFLFQGCASDAIRSGHQPSRFIFDDLGATVTAAGLSASSRASITMTPCRAALSEPWQQRLHSTMLYWKCEAVWASVGCPSGHLQRSAVLQAPARTAVPLRRP